MSGRRDRVLLFRAITDDPAVDGVTGALVRAGPTTLRALSVSNTAATNNEIFLKCYNLATRPVVGTDTPVLTIMVSGNRNMQMQDMEAYFSVGLGVVVTADVGDDDTTAPSADVTLLLGYVPEAT